MTSMLAGVVDVVSQSGWTRYRDGTWRSWRQWLMDWWRWRKQLQPSMCHCMMSRVASSIFSTGCTWCASVSASSYTSIVSLSVQQLPQRFFAVNTTVMFAQNNNNNKLASLEQKW